MKSCEQTAALETNRGEQGPESGGTSSEAMNERVEIGLSESPVLRWEPLPRLYQAPGASPVAQ